MSSITLKVLYSKLTIFNIYHPPCSPALCRNSVAFSELLENFWILISSVYITPNEILKTGNFNIHIDYPTDYNTLQFISLPSLANLTQSVSFPSHCHSHTLDLVIAHSNSILSPTFTSTLISPSDHLPAIYSLKSCESTTLSIQTSDSFRTFYQHQ